MLRICNEPSRGIYIYYMVDFDLDGLTAAGSTTRSPRALGLEIAAIESGESAEIAPPASTLFIATGCSLLQ